MNASIDLECRSGVWTIGMYIFRGFERSILEARSRKVGAQKLFVEDYLLNYKLVGIASMYYRDIQKGVCINLCWISIFFFNLITCFENSCNSFSLLSVKYLYGNIFR